MEPSHRLGDLQHAIMRVLWDAEEATVSEVHAALGQEGGRARALTTIATMLTKMERKGIVAHRSVARHYVYRPTVSEAEVTRSVVAEMTERFFEGSVTALVDHLISEQEIDSGELARLRELVKKRRKGAPE